MDSSHKQATSGQQTSPKVTGILKSFERHPVATTFLIQYGTAIKAITGVGFVAHFLRIRSAIDAQEAAAANNSVSSAKKFSSIRRAGVAGAAWSLVWLGVLSATTLAEESVHRRVDPISQQRRGKVPWNIGLEGEAIMSADFWAGYISGALGILIGNPLDLLKVRLQSSSTSSQRISAAHPSSYASQFTTASSLIRGATAPILGYGALNALLFMTYNRCNAYLTPEYDPNASYNTVVPSLGTAFVAGMVGGLATWIVSTPTELIKCREQVSTTPVSSLALTRSVVKAEGIKGLYRGGTITVMRDSFGYGVYFWAYEYSTRLLAAQVGTDHGPKVEAMKVLLCGGISGVLSWSSIFPLDVLKTRIQTQLVQAPEAQPLLGNVIPGLAKDSRVGALAMAKRVYLEEGAGAFFRGLGICSVRAFVVNAAQWAMYEWIMKTLVAEKGNHVTEKLAY